MFKRLDQNKNLPTVTYTTVTSRETGLPERQVERWRRRRAALDRPSPLDKFAETGWRWVFYFLAHVVRWVDWQPFSRLTFNSLSVVCV